MNVFACDADPRMAAIALADRHVIKMTLETAQILSTTGILLGKPVPGGYRATHRHHPVTVGCVECPDYRAWVWEHGLALASEYTFRFGREHKSQIVIENAEFLTDEAPPSPHLWALARFPLAMDDEHKQDDPFDSYREYLRVKYAGWASKGRPPRWTKRSAPAWLNYLVRLGRQAA